MNTVLAHMTLASALAALCHQAQLQEEEEALIAVIEGHDAHEAMVLVGGEDGVTDEMLDFDWSAIERRVALYHVEPEYNYMHESALRKEPKTHPVNAARRR